MIYLDATDSSKSPMNTGVQRVVRGLFRSLVALGVPVTPLLWDASLESYCTLSKVERGFLENPFAGAAGRKAHARPNRVANAVPLWSKFWRQRTHRRNRFDLPKQTTAADVLIVPQVFKGRQGVWLSGLASRSPIKRFAIFHDAIAWRRPDVTSPANVRGFLEYLLALASFDGIIAVSRESADNLAACWREHRPLNAKTPPITVLDWPVDEHFGGIAPVFGASGEVKKILSVGTFEPRKNHLTLLAAVEKLWRDGSKFELVLVGRTTPNYGNKVEVEIERLRRLGWPVAWRRHVSEETLLAAYDESAFTVYPTLLEGFGLPIIESLQRGRPCICGANGALGELAAGGGCLTVDQTQAERLAEGMRRLLTDGELYVRLCAEARTRRFETWRGYTEKLLPLLGMAAK